jgi:peroxiredoxin
VTLPNGALKDERMIDTKKATPAPDFTAIDSAGKIIRLSDYKGKKHVVLVFNRGFG